MTMALWLPDAIRDEGVEVVEVDGWQTRGHGDPDYENGAFVWHHTADGPNGRVPSLNICINGASYTASGPLCNVVQSRESDVPDKAYVIAAGVSYNAGTGGWNGVSRNMRALGLEIEHTGTAPFPEHRREISLKIAAGCLKAMGRSVDYACHHFEWSYPPGSKIDVCCSLDGGSKCDGDEWRELTRQIMAGGAPSKPPEEPAKRRNRMEVVVGPRDGVLGNVANLRDGDRLLVEWSGNERDVFGMMIPSKCVDFLQGTAGVDLVYLGTTDDPNVNHLKGLVMTQLRWPEANEPVIISD
jgi:hypothetical protein